MTTAEYIKRLRRAAPKRGARGAQPEAHLSAPGDETRPMRAHRAFAALLEESKGAAAHMRGVELPKAMETPRCLLSPLV